MLPPKYKSVEVLWIGGNDSALADQPAQLFDGGLCRLCGNPKGRRNAEPARLSSLPSTRSDGAEARYIGTLFSQNFVDLLGPLRPDGPAFRETVASPSRKKKLFELAGQSLAEFIAVDDIPLQGVQCAKCERKVFHHMIDNELIPFLARDDFPAKLPEHFIVRNLETPILCMTGEAWRAVRGKPGTNNVVAIPVGVAPAVHVLRDPALPLFNG